MAINPRKFIHDLKIDCIIVLDCSLAYIIPCQEFSKVIYCTVLSFPVVREEGAYPKPNEVGSFCMMISIHDGKEWLLYANFPMFPRAELSQSFCTKCVFEYSVPAYL